MGKEMNGEGKEVFLNFDNLATYKQAPYLARGLADLMPKLTINVNEFNEGNREYEVFLRDLKKNDVSANFDFKDWQGDVLNIKLKYSNTSFFGAGSHLNIPIDPLKFSKRKLLNKDEIQDLREKYKIRKNEHVVLGGSFHAEDLKFFKRFLYGLSKEKNLKFIGVPRYPIGSLEQIFDTEGINFEKDEGILGNENNLLISEEGILDDLYSICDVALLGNTFGKFGLYSGQNPLEPAFYGKRMISGCNYKQWNGEAFYGLKKSGLLKVIHGGGEIIEEMLRKSGKEDEINRENALKFMESWEGMEDVYAKIVQKVLYCDLSASEETFLEKKQDYVAIRRKFSSSK